MAEEYDPAFPTGDDDDDEVIYGNFPISSSRTDMSDFNPPVEEQEVIVSTEVEESCEEEGKTVPIMAQGIPPPDFSEECDSLQEKLQGEYCYSSAEFEEVKTAEPIDGEGSVNKSQDSCKKKTQSSVTNTFSNVLNSKIYDSNSTESCTTNNSANYNFRRKNSTDKSNSLKANHIDTSQSKSNSGHLKESLQTSNQGSADNSDSNNSSDTSKNDFSVDGKKGEAKGEMSEKPDSESSNKESSDDNLNSALEEGGVPTASPSKNKRKKNKSVHHDSDTSESSGNTQVRRSSRIKSMEQKKEREREIKEREERERYERECEEKSRSDPEKDVKEEEKGQDKVASSDEESSNAKSCLNDSQTSMSPVANQMAEDSSSKCGKESPATSGTSQHEEFSSPKPEKVKSRWRRSSELERAESGPSSGKNLDGKQSPHSYPLIHNHNLSENTGTGIKVETIEEQNDSESSQDIKMRCESKAINDEELPYFEEINENVYLSERRRHRSKREVKRMVCDCSITKEEIVRGAVACGEDCLNRLLMIECGSRCPTGEYCTNRRFQKKKYIKVEPIKTELKGWGLQTLEDIPEGAFIMEYVGEVLDPREFRRRVKEYARDKYRHYYFMALKSDEIIDATKLGNVSRFINHSCNPNCETQKWTVNGELRIGFFSRKAIRSQEELTFDYQFQRYGKEAQKCYCLSENCRGYIGGDKRTPLKRERNVPKRRKTAEEKKREFLEDMDLEEEIEKLSINGGLKNRDQTLTLSRLMIRAEDVDSRLGLLKILQKTTEQACLRLFLDYHGLSLVWSWMVDVGNNEESIELKNQILQTLQILPISNKTILMDSRVMAVVQRWAQQIAEYQQNERDKDRDSETADSEPTSQAATPRHSDSSEPDKASETAKEALQKLKKVLSTDDSYSSCSDDNSDEIDKEGRDLKLDLSNSRTSVADVNKETVDENDQAYCKVKEDFRVENSDVQEDSDCTKKNNSGVVLTNVDGVCESTALNSTNVTADANKINGDVLIPKLDSSEDQKKADAVDETVEMISDFVKDTNFREERADFKDLQEKMLLENSSEIQESKEGKDDDDMIKDCQTDEEIASSSGVKVNQVANLAAKLLDSWSSLKEAYRIPKREQNQNRREHEREAGSSVPAEMLTVINIETPFELGTSEQSSNRHVHEIEPEDSFCENSFENDLVDKSHEKMKDRGEMEKWNDYYQDRDHEKRDHNDRKHGHNSPEKEHRHMRDKKGLRLDDIHSPEMKGKKRLRNSNLIPLSHNNMMPFPPKLSKEERRHLFELKVQQEEAEEALRKQHEEFLRQQHEALMTIDPPPSAPAPVYYDPNFPQSAYFDPNSGGYLAPPMSMPAPVEGGPPPPVIEPSPNFEPAQPSPVLYQQSVLYQGQPPPFLAPPATPAPPAPAPHFVAPPPTPPIYYPPQNIVPNPTTGPPAVIHLPDQTTPVPAWSQSHLLSLIEEAPPPPEPPKPKPVKLPPNWKTAKDSEGRIYYYHSVTRQTQWEPPSWDPSEENDMDLGTPTYDEPKSKKKLTTTAAADTSSELVKKIKELFRTKMSQFIVQCLNPYRKPDCKIGRISSTEDFKHLARKLTHFVMAKELKHCRNIEDLECNDNVKHKAKDFVKKYMLKFGSTYRKAASPKDD